MALRKITELKSFLRHASSKNRNINYLDDTFKKHPDFQVVPFSTLILSHFIQHPKSVNFNYLLNYVDPTDNGEYRSLESAARQKSYNCLWLLVGHPKVNLEHAFAAIEKRCPEDKRFLDRLESIFNK